MSEREAYPRFASQRLIAALGDSPAVLLHGPRQAGKSTLAKLVGEPLGYSYFTFDDGNLLQAARADPQGFAADLPERAILDEIQHVPELFRALKGVIDRDRTPGRFLLTGSANLFVLPALGESLSGRIEIVRLHPLSQSELRRQPSQFLEVIFEENIRISKTERLGKHLAERVAAGGYPPALTRNSEIRRAAWYRDYVETQIQKDVQDLAKISSLETLPRLLYFAASQSAHLLNVAELAGPFQVSRPTIRDYLTLLKNIFLVDELQPWHTSRIRASSKRQSFT
jgi:predicted AAA+ superfamily ATPase